MATDTTAWDNYWQGRAGDGAGALTGVEHDAELAAFWAGALGDLDRGAPLLDLACGAGTVLKQAQALGFTDLTGADYAPAAIDALEKSLPGVRGVTCSAAKTPFEAGAFAAVVSQFGFEYAGAADAAPEITRLVAPSGHFIAVTHMAEGAIHDEVAGHHAHCRAIADSGYIEQSKALFAKVFAGDVSAVEQAQTVMAAARETVFGLTIPGRPSLAAHLTQGAAELWDNRAKYALRDIHGWFDGMEAQRAAFEARMASMMAAAMDEGEAISVLDIFANAGFKTEAPTALQLGGENAAWVLQASRSA